MLLQRGLDRVIELRPLRVAEPIEALGLPSLLASVAEDGVALGAGGVPFRSKREPAGLDGTQYVAVAAGGNPLFGFRQGDALIAFALTR